MRALLVALRGAIGVGFVTCRGMAAGPGSRGGKAGAGGGGVSHRRRRAPHTLARVAHAVCVLGTVGAVACGGRLAAGEDAAGDGGTTQAPSCGAGPCLPLVAPDASLAMPTDASTSPPPVDASVSDASGDCDATIEDARAPGADAGEDAGLLAPCTGVGNVLHFEVLGTQGPLPVESETYTSVIGFGGPGGPIGQTNSLAVRVMANVPASTDTDSFYLSMPYGTPLGTVSCAAPGPVRVEIVINGYTCVPDSGTVQILDLQVPDAGEQLGSLLVWFDLLSSECTEFGQVASQQEVRGCASYGE